MKTDRRDALALLSCLDRYVAGNTAALTSIRVPAEAEERSRSVSRQREPLLEHRKRLAAQGLSCARYYGHDLPDEWWRARKFESLRRELPEFLFTLLEGFPRITLVVNEPLDVRSEQIESAQTQELPTGLGALSAQILDREIVDGTRFENRRHVASYTGLVPSEDSSGERRHRGAITKHGNPRVRHILIEASWRLQQFQPNYKALPVAPGGARYRQAQRRQSDAQETLGRPGEAVHRRLVAYPNGPHNGRETGPPNELAQRLRVARQGAATRHCPAACRRIIQRSTTAATTRFFSLLERVGARSDPWALMPVPKLGRQLVLLFDSNLS